MKGFPKEKRPRELFGLTGALNVRPRQTNRQTPSEEKGCQHDHKHFLGDLHLFSLDYGLPHQLEVVDVLLSDFLLTKACSNCVPTVAKELPDDEVLVVVPVEAEES